MQLNYSQSTFLFQQSKKLLPKKDEEEEEKIAAALNCFGEVVGTSRRLNGNLRLDAKIITAT